MKKKLILAFLALFVLGTLTAVAACVPPDRPDVDQDDDSAE